MSNYLDDVKWNDAGLVAAIAQDAATGTILMMAWMNRESLALTIEQGHAVYWSRSRNKLWHKGESSGHEQIIKSIYLDCDGDAIILKVEQKGGIACHTGREHCFFRTLHNNQWQTIAPVLKNPAEIYAEQKGYE
jgi:phosphoribosyl-AMP cyclohydrolase